MKRYLIPVLSYFLCFSLFGQLTVNDRIASVENGLTPGVRFKGQPTWAIEDRMAFYRVPGISIAVINNYQLDWAKAYGVSNEKTKQKVTTETAFQAASISKTINAVGLLKWANENNIDFYADINSILKSWQFLYQNDDQISIHDLLTHTAGLSIHGFPGYLNGDNLPTTVQILNGEKPANNRSVKSILPSGEKFKYSGGGTTITQLILEDHVGDYASYMHENIFKVLNMNHSFYPTNMKEDISMSHNRNGKIRKNGYNIYILNWELQHYGPPPQI